MPSPTTLTLSRNRNAAGTQYANAYTVTLKAGQQGLDNKEVRFIVRASSRFRRRYDTTEQVRVTDGRGQAHLALPEFDRCVDIHRDYSVQAEFTPAAEAQLRVLTSWPAAL